MIENAIIESAVIQVDRGFSLGVWIFLKREIGSQGFGGWCLHKIDDDFDNKKGNHFGFYVSRILKIAGVEKWKDIKGKSIRIDVGDKWGDQIEGIGHIIKNEWLYPNKDFTKEGA